MYVGIALTSFDIYAALARRSKSHAVPEKTKRCLSSVAVGNKEAVQIPAGLFPAAKVKTLIEERSLTVFAVGVVGLDHPR